MLKSSLLSKIPNLSHGFGTRDDVLPENLVMARQVHGTNILFAKDLQSRGADGFDVLITDQKGIAVGVRTADCLPILVADPAQGLVAAIHAGWRGTVSRVTEKAIQELTRLGSRIEDLVAALGPHMQGSCYEVGEDVAQTFQKEFPDWPILKKKSPEKSFLDVEETNYLQLRSLGLNPNQIDRLDDCTHCRPDLFHSYRRDGERAGRMVSFVCVG